MSDTPVYRGDMSRMRYDKGCTCHAPRTYSDGYVLPCGDCVSGVHLHHIFGGQYDQACHKWQDTACEIPIVVCVCVAWDICRVLRGEAGGAGIHYLSHRTVLSMEDGSVMEISFRGITVSQLEAGWWQI